MGRRKFDSANIHNRILILFSLSDHYHLAWGNIGRVHIHSLNLPLNCEQRIEEYLNKNGYEEIIDDEIPKVGYLNRYYRRDKDE